jgi:hypothetical protein
MGGRIKSESAAEARPALHGHFVAHGTSMDDPASAGAAGVGAPAAEISSPAVFYWPCVAMRLGAAPTVSNSASRERRRPSQPLYRQRPAMSAAMTQAQR